MPNAGTMNFLSAPDLSRQVKEEDFAPCKSETKKRIECCPYTTSGVRIDDEKRENCVHCFKLNQCEDFIYSDKGDHCCSGVKGGAKYVFKNVDNKIQMQKTKEGDLEEGAHHFVPSAMGKQCTLNGQAYNENNARAICVLGSSRRQQHGACHARLRILLQTEIANYTQSIHLHADEQIESIVVRRALGLCYYTDCNKQNYDGKNLLDLCVQSVVDTLVFCKALQDNIRGRLGEYKPLKFRWHTGEIVSLVALNAGYSDKDEKLSDNYESTGSYDESLVNFFKKKDKAKLRKLAKKAQQYYY